MPPGAAILERFCAPCPVALDNETTAHIWTTTQDLAERFRLTVYDAAHLELAQRRTLPLATLDREVREAGAALGVTLLGGS